MKNLLHCQDSNPGRVSASRAGFTLLELVSVVAIILVLVGLLSSALNRTQAKALRITCLDHLKQLQTAWLMYTDDNDQLFPLNQSVPDAKHPSLVGEILSSNSWVAGNPRYDTDARNIQQGTLFAYVKSADIYRCPMDSSTVTNKSQLARVRSYSISSSLAGDNAGLDPAVKVKFDQLINPSPDNVFVFIEEHESSIWNAGFSVGSRGNIALATLGLASTPSDRHYQGCNLSFADGHVEYWKWFAAKGRTSSKLVGINPREIQDLKRIQSCTPQP